MNRLVIAVAALAAVALLLVPWYVQSTYAIHMMILIFISVITSSAWNILGGFTGQYSIGHAAYFGVGAYTTAILMQSAGIGPWYGIWAGALAAVVTALIVGSICFRLRGPYFVLASIAVTEIFRVCALNLKSITNGAEGILVVTDVTSKTPFYYASLIFALTTIATSWMVKRSKLGYLFQAIREDQDAAHSLGISLTFFKNAALAISAVFTALAGGVYALYVGFIDPNMVLGLETSIQIVVICIIGGIGTIMGPVIGALVLVPLSEALRSNVITGVLIRSGLVSAGSATGLFLEEHLSHAHVLIYGVLVVVVILYMPEGIAGSLRRSARSGGG